MPFGDERESKVSTGEAERLPGGPINSDEIPMLMSSIGSGLLAKQPTPPAEEHVTVAKVCPQCGNEYETGDRFCPKDGAPLKPKGGGDPLIGRVIADRYLILARLGEGGMGRVYAAEHVKMNRQCAIKVMNPSLMNDGESTKRFAREASNAARILHPNVAAVFDYGESERMVYLVMEYIDGESLSSILSREGSLDPRRAIDIARQIADGLTAAHELGLVHRDLKPDNVIIGQRRDGRETAKVVDFGIAKAVSDSPQDSLTRSGLVIGTPEYMSPEQLLGDPVDARADIYALGCILYQMLTGAQPFSSETREQMIRRRLNDPPPHLRETLGDLPRRLDTLIAHMLARSPGDRLATAAEVSAALDPALVLSGWVPALVNRAPVKAPRGAPTVIGPAADPAMQPTLPIKLQKASPTRVAGGAVIGGALLFGALTMWARTSGSHGVAPTAASLLATPPATSLGTTPLTTPPDSTQKRDSVPSKTESKPVAAPRAAATPPKRPAAHSDSQTKTTARTPVVPSDEAAIRLVIEHFATAMAGGEAAVVQEFPEMPATLLNGLRTIFVQGEGFRAMSPVLGPMEISGDRAELPVTIQLRYLIRDSKAPAVYPFRYRATMTKRDGKWELTELAPPP